MKIDGKAIAQELLAGLEARVRALAARGVTPTLAVIQVGDDAGSAAYIRQKQKAADTIGARLIHKKFPADTAVHQVNGTIQQCNNDASVHGLIIQRPIPKGLILVDVVPQKDVDGFLPNSPYPVPVAAAVIKILDSVNNRYNEKSFVVIGRGETAGKPIAEALRKKGCTVTTVHSQTSRPDETIKTADIVISCVGKPNVVRRDNVKKGVVLIGVGIWRDETGKLRGDYEEGDIADVACAYTPTPGGVGPVNVACLMLNLINAIGLS